MTRRWARARVCALNLRSAWTRSGRMPFPLRSGIW